jgi:hypothetical protein
LNPASRLGLFLILMSLTLMLARQPFLDRPANLIISGMSAEMPTENNTLGKENIFLFTRAASVSIFIDASRNVNSTFTFLTTPEEINTYLRNQSLTGVEGSRYSGSFTTTLQIAQRGIHVIVLNFSSPAQSLSIIISSQGVLLSEYTDQLIVFAVGVLLLSPLFLKRLKLVFPTRR